MKCLLGNIALVTLIFILSPSSFGFRSDLLPKRRLDKPALVSRWKNHGVVSVSLSSSSHQVSIEYCTGCRWGLRSFWFAQELLTTFNDEPGLEAVTLLPSRPPAPGGQFVVKCHSSSETTILWDRKEREGFPEIKVLKQLVRDKVEPDKYLGHSDTEARKQGEPLSSEVPTRTEEAASSSTASLPALYNTAKPNVAILYCTGCRWLLRAAYFAQELMSTFESDINSISLVPGRPPSKGGCFVVAVDNKVIWDRAEQGGFPRITELKQIVRDLLDPAKDLGHSDNKPSKEAEEVMDEEDAEEARKFFGVQ